MKASKTHFHYLFCILLFTHFFRKVYIQFVNTSEPSIVNIDGYQLITSMPGKIMPEVYHAVRRRQLGIKNDIDILP